MKVAILKNNEPINCLVFRSEAPDSELQEFAELVGGDSFQKLEYNQFVINQEIVTKEKPFDDWTWSEELQNWDPPEELKTIMINNAHPRD